jgi:hypothetical protein
VSAWFVLEAHRAGDSEASDAIAAKTLSAGIEHNMAMTMRVNMAASTDLTIAVY